MIEWHTLSPQEIERRAQSISPGEWAVDMQRPISTLLGSCVAVCLYDPAVGVGGMNHFMLPNMRKREDGIDVDSLLSGDYAMEVLLNGIIARGGARHRLKAKAFGGGTIISGIAARASASAMPTSPANGWRAKASSWWPRIFSAPARARSCSCPQPAMPIAAA